MSLIIEDGTGISTADALISLADWKTYGTAQGWDYSAYSDTLIENAIRRGSRYISDGFAYKGTKLNRDQAQAWARYGVVDGDGYSVLSTTVPNEVERATAEASWRETTSPNSLTPDITLSGRVKSEAVGPISTTYADTSSSSNAARPDVRKIRDLLKGLLLASGGTVLVRS